MSKMVRRFEVLLPLRFNDGTPVSDDSITDTLLEQLSMWVTTFLTELLQSGGPTR